MSSVLLRRGLTLHVERYGDADIVLWSAAVSHRGYQASKTGFARLADAFAWACHQADRFAAMPA